MRVCGFFSSREREKFEMRGRAKMKICRKRGKRREWREIFDGRNMEGA